MTKPTRSRTRFDQRTAAKQDIGARLREAREMKGLTLTDAARLLGYTQPVHLSYWETGSRMPPLGMLARLAALYGCSGDFLLGMTADPEVDPAAALARHLAARTQAEVDRLVNTMFVEGLTELRRTRPDVARVLRLASTVLEAERAMRRCRELSADFDEMPGGAPVLSRLELAATMAASLLDDLKLGRLSLPSSPTPTKEAAHGH